MENPINNIVDFGPEVPNSINPTKWFREQLLGYKTYQVSPVSYNIMLKLAWV